MKQVYRYCEHNYTPDGGGGGMGQVYKVREESIVGRRLAELRRTLQKKKRREKNLDVGAGRPILELVLKRRFQQGG